MGQEKNSIQVHKDITNLGEGVVIELKSEEDKDVGPHIRIGPKQARALAEGILARIDPPFKPTESNLSTLMRCDATPDEKISKKALKIGYGFTWTCYSCGEQYVLRPGTYPNNYRWIEVKGLKNG